MASNCGIHNIAQAEFTESAFGQERTFVVRQVTCPKEKGPRLNPGGWSVPQYAEPEGLIG